jgi:hypothetical protein
MREIILVSELSLWARRKRDQKKTYKAPVVPCTSNTERKASAPPKGASQTTAESKKKGAKRDSFFASTLHAPKVYTDFSQILVPWDEPSKKAGVMDFSENEIIEFQQALAVVTKPYFLSSAFGPVESRDECTKSAELLFRRLLRIMADGDDTVNLNKMTEWMYKGCHKPEEKQNAADLIDLLSPDKEGCVCLVAFVAAIDTIYRKLRLLENSVNNHSHVDKSYEKVMNFIFYFLIGCVALAILGVDPFVFILSISTLLVSFAFMIGSGVSQQFEGILLVLARQPYDLGDRIAIVSVCWDFR